MRIFHAADLHYCPKHLERVDRAFGFAVDCAIDACAELAILAGDSFDSTMPVHEPAINRLMVQVRRLANHMPVVILQGTFSHDRPGSLDIFRFISSGESRVFVVDEPRQIQIGICLVNCLPSINKASQEVADAGGPAEYVANVMQGWAGANRNHHADGGINILVSHGTVTGCRTESGHAMVSPDHEFSLEVLLSSGVDAVMLGHIHLHQVFTMGGKYVAYPGSIARLVFGHTALTGFLMWNIDHGTPATHHFIETPSPAMVEVVFDGPPDMDQLRELAATSQGAMVRVRAQVDEEYARFIDRQAIQALFSGAEKLSLEVAVNPVQRVRAPGIGQQTNTRQRLAHWANSTDLPDGQVEGLLNRYDQLKSEAA